MNMNEVVDRLFLKLEGRFSTKPPFTRGQEVIDVVKEAWAEEFERKKTTVQQMKKGLDRIVDDGIKFFPDIGDFLSLCKPTPEELGLPSPDNAYEEACKNAHKQSDLRWSHEAVKDAAVKITLHRLKCEARMYTESSFKKHYAEIVEDFVDGNRLPKPTEQPQGPFKPRSGLDCPANRILKERGQESKFKDFEGGPSELIKAVARNFTKGSK